MSCGQWTVDGDTVKIDTGEAARLLKKESEAVAALAGKLDDTFTSVVEAILACQGQVVVTGMGKAGIVGQKIASTLASIKIRSFFLHPSEALHGDLGRVHKTDLVIALSNSGQTQEITRLITELKRIGSRIVGVTGDPRSSLALNSDFVLDIGRLEDPIIPTVSTTAMLALGDALAVTLVQAMDLGMKDFLKCHPGGGIGEENLKVEDVMRTGGRHAVCHGDDTVREVLKRISAAQSGAASIVDKDGKLVGILTDGGFRRFILDSHHPHILEEPVSKVMTPGPRFFVGGEATAAEGLCILRDNKIDEMPVIDENHAPIGMLDVQDLLAAGLT